VTGRERTKRKVIGFNDLPPALVNALTVTEDRDFSITTASTCAASCALCSPLRCRPELAHRQTGWLQHHAATRQNLLLSPERTWSRKVAEAYMS
jgi:membrane carboxypeptidase/penicillin-binding protein